MGLYTVYICSMYGVANDWFCSSRINLHIAPSDRFKYRSGVERGLVEGSVTVDCGDAEEFDARIMSA
jgi:hypothetical protein